MWPYTDEENGWLGQTIARQAPAPQNVLAKDNPAGPTQITPELIAFYEQRARQLRAETMAGIASHVVASVATMFRHLGALSSGNRAKMEATIAEFRRPTAGTAAQ
jgi:hypothetical protein